MHILLKMLGYGVALFSAYCIVVFAAILFDGEEDEAGSTIAAIAFFVGTMALGTYMVRASRRHKNEKREQQILQLAADKGGRITAEEVAMPSELSVEECRKMLDGLCLQGAAQLQVTAEGVMEYLFSGLATAEPPTKPDRT